MFFGKMSNRQRTLNITLIALFAAISYISLVLFFFPFAHMFIHFGNLVVVTASLLIGGWQGGLAGSIGMGLYDLLNGHIDSAPKTFLLKFLIGLTVGLVYNFFKTRKKYPSVALFIAGGTALLMAAAMAVRMILLHTAGKSAVLCPLFAVIGVLCVVFGLLKNRLSAKTASAVVGAASGMLINIAGEFLWKVVQYTIAGSDFSAAVTASLLAQGSTLINAGIAVVGGVLLFGLLEKPFVKITNR